MLPPLAVEGSEWMNEFGWALLAVIGMFVFSLYIWSYLSKHFEVAKAKEGKYLDKDVLEFLERAIKVSIILILTFLTTYAASLISDAFKEAIWDPFNLFLVDIILIFIVLMIAMLVVRVLRRVARRARIKSSNEVSIHPSAVEFTSLFMGYVVYAITAVIVIIIFLSMIPQLDLVEALEQFVTGNAASLGGTLAIVIAIYFLDRLLEAILEDYKFRTKKFSPNEIDLMKSTIRYALMIIAILTTMFAFLSLVGLAAVGLILVLMTMVFLSLALALSYSTIQNIVAGFGLMDTGPFDVGDRIKVKDSLVCDVVEKGLIFTRVRTLDGEVVDIPNKEMIEEKIYNYSLSGIHGISISMEVPFEVPHAKVEDLIVRASGKVEGLIKDQRPRIYGKDFLGDRILYEVVVYTKEAQKNRRIRSSMILRIQEEFQKEGIGLSGE
ncbi:MAG: mechanosensitive ion channel family protein [Methanomassiliicoccales archaeon]